MHLNSETKDGQLWLNIQGRIDNQSWGKFQTELLASLKSDLKFVVLDCSQLEYVNSAGLRVFLMALKQLKPRGGQFVLAEMRTGVKEIFDIAGFTNLFKILGTRKDVEAFFADLK